MKYPVWTSVVFSLAALVLCSPRGDAQTKHADGCDWTSFERGTAGVHAALDAAKVISEDEGNTDVSPEAIKQIQEFKNQLHTALSAYFRCKPNLDFGAREIERDLYARLGIPEPPAKTKDQAYDEKDHGPWTGLYLSDPTIKVEMVADTRKLVAVLTTFGVPYGQDAELDVFAQEKDSGWNPAIHLTSKPYDSIAGAFKDFDYRISPADRDGHWFVLATHINPWPTSCWQSLFTDVVRPEDLGMQYQFFHHEDYGYVCTDDAPYIRAMSENGFQIRFRISSIDESQLESVSVMTYKMVDDEVLRVDPAASDPVNFADEWTRRPWLEARGWSGITDLLALERAHSNLRKAGSGDFVGFRACTGNFLNEVEFDTSAEHSRQVRRWFFLIQGKGPAYRMERVGGSHSPSCAGRNRLNSSGER